MMTSDEPTIFHFYNRFHLGDNIYNLKFFRYIAPILREKKYIINYYYNTEWRYNTEVTLRSYIDPTVLHLKPLHEKPEHSIELWMGNVCDGIYNWNLEAYFNAFYKKILCHLNIVNQSVSTSIWIDEPFISTVYDSLDAKFKDVDILILNSIGHSGQFNGNTQLPDVIRYLNDRFNIVTLDIVDENIKSLQNNSIQEICAICTHAKYVITTCSATQVACYNKAAKEHVKKWFYITSGCIYKMTSIDVTYLVKDLTPIKTYFDGVLALKN
jgi:hypothetical protein